MATKKSAGTSKNGRDSNPRYLGIKLTHGDSAKVGSIIVRQKGRNFLAGKNVGVGKDHTMFALKEGKIAITSKRKLGFTGKTTVHKVVHVVTA
ncbi:MAG: hypothetical protein RLZZ347_767 [Candidatus Parcubacteria bacterium]|jgi:large subunit ribosomal protein L27